MTTIRIVVDEQVRRTVDQVARQMRCSRSGLVREALREHLRRLDQRQKEERDREDYRTFPQSEEEIRLWEGKAVWH